MIDADSLRPEVRAALRAAGWHEGRRVPLAEATRHCRLAGYPDADEQVSEVISTLCGLQPVLSVRWLAFRPEMVARFVDHAEVAALEGELGEALYPFATSSYANILLTPSRRCIYVDWDWLFYHGYPSVEALCNGILGRYDAQITFDRWLAPEERPPDFA